MALEQTIIGTLPMPELVAAHKEARQPGEKRCNIMRVIARLKKAQLESLRAELVSGKLSVTLGVFRISEDSAVERMLWLGRRKLGDVKIVSWSNCIDYLPTECLHKIAKTIGSNATHIGYSMNWTGDVKGANIVDYPKEKERIRLMDQANTHIESEFKAEGLTDIFRLPTLSNAKSNGCASVMKTRREAWTASVFGQTMNEKFGVVLCGVHDPPYNPLARINFTPYFQWRYQQEEEAESVPEADRLTSRHELEGREPPGRETLPNLEAKIVPAAPQPLPATESSGIAGDTTSSDPTDSIAPGSAQTSRPELAAPPVVPSPELAPTTDTSLPPDSRRQRASPKFLQWTLMATLRLVDIVLTVLSLVASRLKRSLLRERRG
jgi:hypothetical protein